MYHIRYTNSFILVFTFDASGFERPNLGCEFEEQWFSPTYIGSTKKGFCLSPLFVCVTVLLHLTHVTSDSFCAVFGVQLNWLSFSVEFI